MTTYHISFITFLPVQQVGTVELPEDEDEAQETLLEKLEEQYPMGVELTYFSTEKPTPEQLKLADVDTDAPSTLSH